MFQKVKFWVNGRDIFSNFVLSRSEASRKKKFTPWDFCRETPVPLTTTTAGLIGGGGGGGARGVQKSFKSDVYFRDGSAYNLKYVCISKK